MGPVRTHSGFRTTRLRTHPRGCTGTLQKPQPPMRRRTRAGTTWTSTGAAAVDLAAFGLRPRPSWADHSRRASRSRFARGQLEQTGRINLPPIVAAAPFSARRCQRRLALSCRSTLLVCHLRPIIHRRSPEIMPLQWRCSACPARARPRSPATLAQTQWSGCRRRGPQAPRSSRLRGRTVFV